MEKMKLDWVNMTFSFAKYRDTVSVGPAVWPVCYVVGDRNPLRIATELTSV